MSRIERNTKETQIDLEVRAGSGEAEVESGDAFLDHMLVTLARYAKLDLNVKAGGDMRHHLIEDVAITLGLALREEIPETCARYGWCVLPMDEALVEAAVDLGGRPYFEGELSVRLYTHFLQSLAFNLGATLHLRVIRGEDRHHVVEAAVKAVGLCLRQAMAEGDDVFSTKGSVELIRHDGESTDA